MILGSGLYSNALVSKSCAVTCVQTLIRVQAVDQITIEVLIASSSFLYLGGSDVHLPDIIRIYAY